MGVLSWWEVVGGPDDTCETFQVAIECESRIMSGFAEGL